MKLNGIIQLITFGVWPLLGLSLSKGMRCFCPSILPASLIDGLVILCCLPTTINMCIILTSSAGGSGKFVHRTYYYLVPHSDTNYCCVFILVATALCNTVISNLAGIFITPALLLHFFGKSIELPFLNLVKKLCSKVLLPVAVGQALRATPIKDFYSKQTAFFKRFQEVSYRLCDLSAVVIKLTHLYG